MTAIKILAERGGFEPPWELVTPKSISSRSRYDHFGTSPLILSNISNATSYYNERFRPTSAGRPAHNLKVTLARASRSRYDHFGTSSHRINRRNRLLPSFVEKIYSKLPRILSAIFLQLFPPDDSIFHQSKYYIVNPPRRISDHAPRK